MKCRYVNGLTQRCVKRSILNELDPVVFEYLQREFGWIWG